MFSISQNTCNIQSVIFNFPSMLFIFCLMLCSFFSCPKTKIFSLLIHHPRKKCRHFFILYPCFLLNVTYDFYPMYTKSKNPLEKIYTQKRKNRTLANRQCPTITFSIWTIIFYYKAILLLLPLLSHIFYEFALFFFYPRPL